MIRDYKLSKIFIKLSIAELETVYCLKFNNTYNN